MRGKPQCHLQRVGGGFRKVGRDDDVLIGSAGAVSDDQDRNRQAPQQFLDGPADDHGPAGKQALPGDAGNDEVDAFGGCDAFDGFRRVAFSIRTVALSTASPRSARNPWLIRCFAMATASGGRCHEGTERLP